MPLKAKIQFPSDTTGAPPNDSEEHLCFLPAYQKCRKGEITWEQYLHHTLLHWTGKRHDDDYKRWHLVGKLDGGSVTIVGRLSDDPVTFALWKWQHSATGVRDVADLEAVFQAYETGAPETVEAKLSVLTDDVTRDLLESVLALLALQQRKLDVLRSCLQRHHPALLEFPMDTSFQAMVGRINKYLEPELHDIIENSQWRRDCPRIKGPIWRAPRGDD